MTDPFEQPNISKKNGEKKEEEKITTYADGKDVYHIGDTVYIESQRPDMPYFICSVRDFKRSKKDNITVDVIWYYRPCEIPTSVYQLLLQDRNAEYGSTDHVLDSPVVKNRELFISDAIDVYPAHALRGHATCLPFSDVKENVMQYIQQEDNWFYILRYNPESRRMANAKGEIRIGVSHQAYLPPCITYNERNQADLKQLHDYSPEELVWDPTVSSSKLTVYLRAARSITSYNDYCDGQEVCPEKTNGSISEDKCIAYCYDTLHQNKYNISEALQELIRSPAPQIKTHPFTDDERRYFFCDENGTIFSIRADDEGKKFMRGLRSYGKTFHKIRKELLPDRTTAELVHYFYIWKKTAAAISSRPHKRGGRRNNVLARKTRTTKPKTAEASEFLDLSSCSENEFDDSEDSEHTKNTSLYACRHCYTTESRNWHHAGKPKMLLCTCCRLHYKRYGHMKTIDEENKREPPPFIYKATFENLEDDSSSTGRMRTRRSSTPVFTTKIRQPLEGKGCNRKQITTPVSREQLSFDKDEMENNNKNIPNGAKRKVRNNTDDSQEDAKRTKIEGKESDEAEDADDESEDESESGSREDSTTQISSENSRSQSPEELQQQILIKPKEEVVTPERQPEALIETIPINPVPTLLPIVKEEVIQEKEKTPVIPVSPPSSPDVAEDLELNKKIADRFKHNETQTGNSCSRCERIYIFKRPKKQRSSENEMKRREELVREREYERRREGGPSPPSHQPAQITSHYETMRMLHQAAAVREHRIWPPNSYQQLPPEVHAARSISPREYIADSKFINMFGLERQPNDPHGRVAHPPHSMHGPQAPHPAHPFTPRPSEVSRDFRLPPSIRNHIGAHLPPGDSLIRVPPTDGLPRVPPCSEGSRIPNIDRTVIDPATGLPHVQPHLHSHLHTHTHLHVHPDDNKYNRHPDVSHFERERLGHPVRQPSPVQHRPSSRNPDYHEHILKQYPDLRPHLQIDPHLRDAHVRHVPPPGARENLHSHSVPPTHHEGAPSPNPHEISDPVQYHHWLTDMQHRLNASHGPHHPQAPDLSPHGIPHPRYQHEIRSEHEKHMQAHAAEREKLAARAAASEHLRSIEHEKHLAHEKHFAHDKHFRHMMAPREEHLDIKMKTEIGIPERNIPPFRSDQLHAAFNNHSHFMEPLRRTHDNRPNLHERNFHERLVQERLERERMVHTSHDRIFLDRARHDRPSIFSHYNKPPAETIDLSED